MLRRQKCPREDTRIYYMYIVTNLFCALMNEIYSALARSPIKREWRFNLFIWHVTRGYSRGDKSRGGSAHTHTRTHTR